MRKFLIAAAALTAFAGTASAADIAARPYTKAPVAIADVYNWTGFYIGGNVGGTWLDSDHNVASPVNGFAGSAGFTDSNVIGGGQIGYNWQFSPNWLFGIEGDVSYTELNTSSTLFRVGTDHIDATGRLTTQGAIRGRLGWVSNQWLLYAVGGVAFGQTDTSVAAVRDGVGADVARNTDTRVGWTAGGGIEYMFAPNWIAGVEYRYTDLGSADVALPAGPFPAAHGPMFANVDYRTSDVRFRLNYKFGGPVAARY